MNIYHKLYKPSRLYIKRLAGVYYFGKTNSKDIYKYTGSGKVWKDRIKKYGKEKIETLWVSDWYTDPLEIEQVAKQFSIENNIVTSSTWANLKEENGLDGGDPGYLGKMKISKKLKGNIPWNKNRKLQDEKYKKSGRMNKGKSAWNKGKKLEDEKYKKSGRMNKDRLLGDKNHLYGRSIIREKNLKWYSNGVKDIYVTEGTEPDGYCPGRSSWSNKFKGGKKTNKKLNPCISPDGTVYETVYNAAVINNLSAKAILERIRRYEKGNRAKPGWRWYQNG